MAASQAAGLRVGYGAFSKLPSSNIFGRRKQQYNVSVTAELLHAALQESSYRYHTTGHLTFSGIYILLRVTSGKMLKLEIIPSDSHHLAVLNIGQRISIGLSTCPAFMIHHVSGQVPRRIGHIAGMKAFIFTKTSVERKLKDKWPVIPQFHQKNFRETPSDKTGEDMLFFTARTLAAVQFNADPEKGGFFLAFFHTIQAKAEILQAVDFFTGKGSIKKIKLYLNMFEDYATIILDGSSLSRLFVITIMPESSYIISMLASGHCNFPLNFLRPRIHTSHRFVCLRQEVWGEKGSLGLVERIDGSNVFFHSNVFLRVHWIKGTISVQLRGDANRPKTVPAAEVSGCDPCAGECVTKVEKTAYQPVTKMEFEFERGKE
ncbi:hypothetical protein HPP92_028830 [Vanilla planifolia]|uniref:Uncharacterized protein n=1 Tax=Vanilla planifolia TaxID=51239 RepID=A0A835U300_VANPL|nr:hypothetical protein HPP92_028830 [Vanilla planifolia]